MFVTYASSHIDGGLDCSNLSIGVLKNVPGSPVVRARVLAGQQSHPVWALDRLAVTIFSFVQSARLHYPNGPQPIQVNLRSALFSDANTSCIVAESIVWHTSERIRRDAEQLMRSLEAGANLPVFWPSSAELTIPVYMAERPHES